MGVGIAYTKLKGDFIITNIENADYGKLKQVSPSVAIYLEAKRGNHLIVIQDFMPITNEEGYQFEQNSIVLSYSYLFQLN